MTKTEENLDKSILLIEKNKELRLFFEFVKGSNDIIFLVNHKSKTIEFANDKACTTLGYTLKELKSMKISQIRKAYNDKKEIPQVFSEIKNKKTMTTLGQYLCKDKSIVYVETSLSLKSYENEKYVMAISRDISERLELEKQKDELNQKLENYNNTLKEEVFKIRKELLEYESILSRQSKMAAMGEMLENIAHQWRQPLSVISVLSTGMLVQNEADTLNKKFIEQGLNDINTSAQYLSKTIEDFRDYFKPNYEKSSFYISEVLEYSTNLIKTKFNSTKSNIKIIEDIKDSQIYTFKNELIQVLINILNNAADELESKKQKVKLIFISIYTEEQNIIIEIKDNAGGIHKNIIDRIFEPYFTTKHKSLGTGVGLYMSDEIIKKHMNGNISVINNNFTYENIPYKGAIFKIVLPKH